MKKIIGLIILFVISVLSFADVANVNGGILFTYEDANATSVFLAGSMNDWNSEKDKLIKDKNGIWYITKFLEPGGYSYKYVVDGKWILDPVNIRTVTDMNGELNSYVEIK